MRINLAAEGAAQKNILDFLEKNASKMLVSKINNGVQKIKDGKTLLMKKDLTGFMNYACEEARKIAEKGANSCAVISDTVYGWAIHYFEEDSIDGKFFNLDGSPYSPPKKQIKHNTTTSSKVIKIEPIKAEVPQMSLFEMIAEEPPKDKVEDFLVKDDVQKAYEKDLAKRIDNYQEEPEEDDVFEELEEDDVESVEEIEEILSKPPEQPKYELNQLGKYYKSLTEQYPNTVIAIRLGDFYEILGENAKRVAEVIDFMVAYRDLGLKDRVPMIGFPYHLKDLYFEKICEHFSLAVFGRNKELEFHADGIPENYSVDENGEIHSLDLNETYQVVIDLIGNAKFEV